MESEDEEGELQLHLSQIGAKKKLCFGGMTPKKHTRDQKPGISLGRDDVDDVPETLQPQQKQDIPVIVKTEKLKKASAESTTKEI